MKKLILITAAAVLAVIFTGCIPTTQTNDPLEVTFVGYCDQDFGLDVMVKNIGDTPVPVTVTFGGPVYEEGQYDGGTKIIAVGQTKPWSFPGSRPSEVTVRIGDNTGIGWISQEMEYCS